MGLWSMRSIDQEAGSTFGVHRTCRWVLAGLASCIAAYEFIVRLVLRLEISIDRFDRFVRWSWVHIAIDGDQYLWQTSQGDYG